MKRLLTLGTFALVGAAAVASAQTMSSMTPATTGTTTPAMSTATTAGSFDKLSPGGQKIATAIFDAEKSNFAGGTAPKLLSLDDIAAMKLSGVGWGEIVHRLQKQGLVTEKNLGHLVKQLEKADRLERERAKKIARIEREAAEKIQKAEREADEKIGEAERERAEHLQKADDDNVAAKVEKAHRQKDARIQKVQQDAAAQVARIEVETNDGMKDIAARLDRNDASRRDAGRQSDVSRRDRDMDRDRQADMSRSDHDRVEKFASSGRSGDDRGFTGRSFSRDFIESGNHGAAGLSSRGSIGSGNGGNGSGGSRSDHGHGGRH